jgi:hypothetical protein
MPTSSRTLSPYYLRSIDRLRLLDKLVEDNRVGNFTFTIAGPQVSRELLDSIAEISRYLEQYNRWTHPNPKVQTARLSCHRFRSNQVRLGLNMVVKTADPLSTTQEQRQEQSFFASASNRQSQ